MNLKPLVNNTELYKSFQEYVQKEIEQVLRHLETEPEPRVVYQLQGEVRRLRRFLTLKERVNDPK